ncbi:PAS domain-containing sensor histidine kinase [Pandoraea terrigena]|uniref:Oxygen sensor histidine kinase NreB n=1 Tax=Pandoraea terrigena TaxID=2508292 RepID=A0A5E4WPU7_9BURK|nr:PAS domain-containing sensor histidine kinase [Pandoraea terrigena]VVE26997.1 Oxygen sensor histidine kinase NreB [Pandoraea terrigena]
MAKLTFRGAIQSLSRGGDGIILTLLCSICLALATWNWLAVRTTLHSNVDARFDLRTTAATDKLAIALSVYRDTLHSALDRLAITPHPDEKAWGAYAQNMRLAERLPGLVTFARCERTGDTIARIAAYSVGNEVLLGPSGSLVMPSGTTTTGRAFTLTSPSTGRAYFVFLSDTSRPSICAYAVADIDALVHVAIGPLLHDITLTVNMPDSSGQSILVFDSLYPRAPGEPRPSVDYRSSARLPYADKPALLLRYTASDEFAALRGAGVANWTFGLGLGMTVVTMLACLLALLARRHGRGLSERDAPEKRRSESRLFSVIQSVREAIVTIDAQQRIQIFNPTAESVFRCSAMEAIGEPLARFIPERFRDAHYQHIERFGMTGVSERLMGRGRPLWGLRSDGEEFPMEASISQSADADGKFYTVVLRDVTEQRQIANALQTSRSELEKLNARLEAVREEEKLRVARELHDDLGQRLTALKMDTALLKRALGDQTSVSGDVRRIEQSIDGMVAAVRQMAADLRPPMLDDLGLGPAIEWYARDFTRRYGVAVDFTEAHSLPPIPAPVATALFRIVQEALNNVAKHARATSVTIELSCDRECRLRISDNGRGLPPTRPKPDSLGFISMRERARLLGGALEVRSPSEGGTVVSAVIPMETQAPADLPGA